MISRPYKAIWAMPLQVSRWMYTAMFPKRCASSPPSGWRNLSRGCPAEIARRLVKIVCPISCKGQNKGQAKEKSPETQKIPRLFWRSGRDSNPRVVSHKLISSQPRYDLFDTAAYLFFKHRPARYLEKCENSMQDNTIQGQFIPRKKPAVWRFGADEMTNGTQTFELAPL